MCHLWRDFALQDTLLWKTIHFVASEPALRRAKRYIQLSDTAPLDIYMTVVNNGSGFLEASKSCGIQFIELIEPESYRWRTLEVQYTSLLSYLKPLWNGQAPMLEHLSISPQASLSAELPLFRLMPGESFTSLTIARFPLLWSQWECASITHLSLGPFSSFARGPTNQELYDILSITSNQLSSLTIKGSWDTLQNESPLEIPIVLGTLKSLTISSEWGLQVIQVLRVCRFPALINLDTYFPVLVTLPPAFLRLLSEEPVLFRSVKRLTIGGILGVTSISSDTIFKDNILQRAFPQVEHVQLSPYMPLETLVSDILSRLWGTMARLDLPQVDLSDVKKCLSQRLRNYPTHLRELTISVASGSLYKEDYEWIRSHVDRFTIVDVRPDDNRFPTYRRIVPFEERLLKVAPGIRPSKRPMQVRAL